MSQLYPIVEIVREFTKSHGSRRKKEKEGEREEKEGEMEGEKEGEKEGDTYDFVRSADRPVTSGIPRPQRKAQDLGKDVYCVLTSHECLYEKRLSLPHIESRV